jgi:hypothetical protein
LRQITVQQNHLTHLTCECMRLVTISLFLALFFRLVICGYLRNTFPQVTFEWPGRNGLSARLLFFIFNIKD